MAHIKTNTTGTQPVLEIKALGTSAVLVVPCLQDITINASTGVFSYTAFCSADTLKLTTPGDNSVETNIVIDDVAFFGDELAAANSAPRLGVFGLSQNKVEIEFTLYWAGKTAGDDYITTGAGFISSLAMTTSPESPIWVTPMSIAVNGSMITSKEG
jgi:hypothetical protein